MEFVDIHTHILWGVDDGARSEDQMKKMLDAAYADGARLVCLTPHYHPGYFGENREKSEQVFVKLQIYGEKYPDLELRLANELRWAPGCIEWLDRGQCRTLDGSRVLVDFSAAERTREITNGLARLLRAGYEPVLAHVERYVNLWGKWSELELLRDRGTRFQLTASALTGGSGLQVGFRAGELVRRNMVDFISSDAHNMDSRRPGMKKAYERLSKKYGSQYADALCGGNAWTLLSDRKG